MLCQGCRDSLLCTASVIHNIYEEELYSLQLAKNNSSLIVTKLDKCNHFFPTIYNWLTMYSNLNQMGVFSISNFWYLLLPTWLHQIQISNMPHKQNYITHINTANNHHCEDILITTSLQQHIFFLILSLVFNFSIQLYIIRNQNNQTSLINYSKQANLIIKQINIRKSIDGTDIVEPWIEQMLVARPAVEVQFYSKI